MTWFRTLTGFDEQSPDQVRASMTLSDTTLTSLINGNSWSCGTLSMPTLRELRLSSAEASVRGAISVAEVVADVQALHLDTANAGALFQVASQFNLLEMTHPDVTPEEGVAIYDYDRTQGPACAIAAGAGTIYRNYFVQLRGQVGQSHSNQLDCLEKIATALGNEDHSLWSMTNGYALPRKGALSKINEHLASLTNAEIDVLRSSLQIGIQSDTQVTLDRCTHTVSQAYCSAMPVAYSGELSQDWEPFARLILEAAYEATICAGIINAKNTGNRTVFLTLLGGGVFGNDQQWIIDAIDRALALHANSGMAVRIVSFGRSKPAVAALVRKVHDRING
ncbi:MAG: hypothetical protein AAGF93_16650 [Cyanobacteria bacterium P01_H01_bin.105]